MEPKIKSFWSRDADGLGVKINLEEKIDEDGKNWVKKLLYYNDLYFLWVFLCQTDESTFICMMLSLRIY